MKENILLTIAVPTYNRRKFLETTVNRSIRQILDAGLENEVEIVISNNDSPDDTREYVEKVNTEYSFVRGFHQTTNIGLAKNLEWVVNESRGAYVQIFGDDDLMEDGAIVYFIKSIKEKRPNFILINTDNIHSLDDSNQKYKVILENRLRIHNDVFIENFDKDRDILKSVHNWLYLTNFITAVIFRKDLWKKEVSNALQYVDRENVFFWQAPVLIGIKKYGKFLLIAKRFILCRKNPTDNYVLDPRGLYYINLYHAIEITTLLRHWIPEEYKKHKKKYAAFITSSFMTEVSRGRKHMRKFAFIAFYRFIDMFPENIQFLAMVISPKLVTKFAPTLRAVKKIMK